MRFSLPIFWLLCVTTLFAQEAKTTPQAAPPAAPGTPTAAHVATQAAQGAYNGQKISSVSLIANPHRDLEPLWRVVSIKSGEPYSEEKIQESAEALKKAGSFAEVQISVDPDVAGPRVNFQLEPPYYLGVVGFPGAERALSYTRLLQIADLPDEDPYDATRVAAAEQALGAYLKRSGYFQSTLHSEISIDDAHQLVSVNFIIQLGERARIGSISVEGPPQPEGDKLVRAIRSLRARLSGALLKPGKRYSENRIASAESFMKKTLTKQQRLSAIVSENPPQYDPATNRVAVSFKVKLGPRVALQISGARLTWVPWLGKYQMKKLIPVYSEEAIDRDLVDEGERNLVEYFQKKGYNDVKVDTSFQRQTGQVLITYTIDRGRKRKVGRILFSGNADVPSTDLLPVVVIKKSHLWTHGRLSLKLMKQSSDYIIALYRDRGYEQVKVTPRTVDRDQAIDVAFDIDEGPRTTVEDVKVAGNEHIPEDQLTKPKGFQIRAGVPFSPRRLADDRNRISATYQNRGYLTAEVKASVTNHEGSDHRVDVTYTIIENQMVRVNDVVNLGQDRTRLSLLTKTQNIGRESPMRREQLLGAESRLYDLNIFDWASVGPRRPITDQTEEAAVVKVHEAKRNEITYGFGFEVAHRGGNAPSGTVALPGGGGTIGLNGYKIAESQSTFASPLGSIQFTRRNVRGLAETANALISLAQLDQRFLASYVQPHFIGAQWQSLSSFSIERNSENPLFTANLGDLSFQVERVISRKTNTRVQLRYDFNKTILSHILVPDLVLPQDQNVRLSTVSGTLIRDTRDFPLDAKKGTFSTLNLGITPTAFGSSANFAKLFGQYAFYKSFHSTVFANSLRIGLATPFAGSFVPTSQLFFTGGGTSLRGFPIDAAGPQRLVPFCNVLEGESGCVNITVPVGGKQLFILNSEIRFPLRIYKALGGVLFYDGGNAYSAINISNFAANYTNTVGFGLRYATPIGPVRIDVGRNLSPVPGLNPTQYFITIGQAF